MKKKIIATKVMNADAGGEAEVTHTHSRTPRKQCSVILSHRSRRDWRRELPQKVYIGITVLPCS